MLEKCQRLTKRILTTRYVDLRHNSVRSCSTIQESLEKPRPSTFVQDEPHHENPFTGDAFLQRYVAPNQFFVRYHLVFHDRNNNPICRWLLRTIPKEFHDPISQDLTRQDFFAVTKKRRAHFQHCISDLEKEQDQTYG